MLIPEGLTFITWSYHYEVNCYVTEMKSGLKGYHFWDVLLLLHPGALWMESARKGVGLPWVFWCLRLHLSLQVAQLIKNPPALRDTWALSLGREDPLEKETATPSSTLTWRIPLTEDPGGLQSMGSQRIRHDWATSLVHWFHSRAFRFIPWLGS